MHIVLNGKMPHNMKKIAMICGAIAMLALSVSCSKERTCTCAVRGELYKRTIKIDKGTCEDLRYVLYDLHRVTSRDVTDSILCTDFDFSPYENE